MILSLDTLHHYLNRMQLHNKWLLNLERLHHFLNRKCDMYLYKNDFVSHTKNMVKWQLVEL